MPVSVHGPRALVSSLLIAALGLVLAGCATPPMSATPGRPSGGQDGPPSQTPANLADTPDPEPRIEPIKRGGPNKRYSVLGRSYEPVAFDVPWKERGIASWYGQKFQGRRTASGELFSLYGLTAAHPTLPIPSYARVRHVATGKEVIVRVNDRGPFHSSRVMDLSYAAALKLGIVNAGSAEVEVERLTFEDIRTGAWRKRVPGAVDGAVDDPIMALAAASNSGGVPASSTGSPDPVSESTGRAYTSAAQGYWVQLAAFSQRDGVEKLQQRVTAELASLTPLLAVFKEAALFRLQVGPYESHQQAQSVAQAVREALDLNPMVIERR
ncbi:MAG: septal ring lytic transglycosylase RlpA family protein [Burkholderiales bacterium]|nr:septal ring lytic transglycosylase RlpA family protein [Burkholderiales bacterium]